VGQGASGSLLGMLGPVVMGTIAKQQSTGSLDAKGIASLLASQKASIAAALPAGLGKLLGGTGLLDSLGDAAGAAANAGQQTVRTAPSAAAAVTDTGRRAVGARGNAWLYWLIPLAAIAALLVYYFANQTEQTAAPNTPPAQSLTVGGLDIGNQVTDSMATLRTTLDGITDAATAQAATPKLQEVTTQLDKVDGLLGQLSPEQRKLLAGLVNPMMPTLNQLFDKVLAIPGVGDVLKPTIDALRGKLATLAA